MKGLATMAQAALDFSDLPDDGRARAEILELRTVPDPLKPVVSQECEASLAPVEEGTAQCYAHMEESTFRLLKLAKRIRVTIPTRRADTEPV